MSTHTPGPWTVNYRDGRAAAMYGHSVSSNIYSKPGVASGQDAIVEVRGVTDEAARANARLIAAAPDLLAVLKSLVVNDGRILGINLGALKPAVLAAIAKAEGTS